MINIPVILLTLALCVGFGVYLERIKWEQYTMNDLCFSKLDL